jgi:cysteinyl-tRNA synthetase
MHNAWVTMAGEKMSKSLGNTADVLAAAKTYGGRAVRLYLAAPHYRSAIELSEASLTEAATQLARIDGFLERAADLVDRVTTEVPAAFASAMDDDLGTPAAMAVLFNTVKAGNVAIEAGDTDAIAVSYAEVLAMLSILGLDPNAPEWAASPSSGDDLRSVVDGLVAAMLEQRTLARERKDWAAADAIRDRLAVLGLNVTDTPDGPRWMKREMRTDAR